MSKEKISLYNKIHEVMQMVSHIEKDAKNAHQGYAYSSDANITATVRTAMLKVGLVMHLGQTKTGDVIQTPKGGNVVQITQEYVLCCITSGESITCSVPGQGYDSTDKGVYKALTGAKKYFLLQTFCIPTGDDPEKDSAHKGVTTYKPPATPIDKDPFEEIAPPSPSQPDADLKDLGFNMDAERTEADEKHIWVTLQPFHTQSGAQLMTKNATGVDLGEMDGDKPKPSFIPSSHIFERIGDDYLITKWMAGQKGLVKEG